MATSFVSVVRLPRLLVPLIIRSSCSLNRIFPLTSKLYSTVGHLQIGEPRRGAGNRLVAFRPIFSSSKSEAVDLPRSVPVRVAHELQQAGHRYLDVRTEEEFKTGHAIGAINIPYMFRTGLGMSKNQNFLKEVSSYFGKDDEIIIGCQSGKRSMMAATDLVSAGFTGITDIAGGYSAWTQNGLPAEQA